MTYKHFIPYPVIAIVITCLAIIAHHKANTAPIDHISMVINADYRNYNLTRHDYPFNSIGTNSILSNIGQNQFTECAVLLSVLAPNKHSLKDAILPRTLKKRGSGKCQLLKDTNNLVLQGDQATITTKPLRTRYWWGARTLYASALQPFNLYEVRELIRNITMLAYCALAILLCLYSARALALGLPLIVFGMLFSGVTHYSEIILGVPYLLALLVPIGMLSLHQFKRTQPFVGWWLFATGCLSSFVWLLDGHLNLVFAWVCFLAFLFAQAQNNPSFKSTITLVFKQLSLFGFGFLSCYLLGLLVKASLVGFSPVFVTAFNSVKVRSSNQMHGDTELSFSHVLDLAIGIGYKTVGALGHDSLWNLILYSSALAGFIGFIVIVAKALKGHRTHLLGAVLIVAIGVSIILRFYLLQNHTAIHAYFIGRYFFISLAAMWMLLIFALMTPKLSQPK